MGGRIVEASSDEHVAPMAHFHEAGFYADDPSLLDEYARFAEAALDAGKAVIACLTTSRRDKLQLRLQARGVDVESATRQGRYVAVDVPTALSSCIVDGLPDEARFWCAAHSLILGAARASKTEHPRIAAFGECAPGLLRDGNETAAILLEQLWDELSRTYDLDVFCGYSSDVSRPGEHNHVFREISAAHSAVHVR